MLICDTHADTLWARARRKTNLDVTIDRLADARHTRVQVLALFVETGGMQRTPTIVQQELAAFETMKAEGFHHIRTVEEAQSGRANVMLSIEGGEAFGGDAANVERFAQLGVRIAALMWNNENGIGRPALSGSNEGLTPYGREVVRRMHAAHMAVDVSHLNERGMYQALDTGVPIMASHSCARRLCDHPRNLTDDQLRAMFQNGGYVGVNFYNTFLHPDSRADIDTVIDHMAHMCDLGGEDHVGFGSDFDGIELHPAGLAHAGDVPALIDRLQARGFGKTLTEKIAGLNFQAYMQRI